MRDLNDGLPDSYGSDFLSDYSHLFGIGERDIEPVHLAREGSPLSDAPPYLQREVSPLEEEAEPGMHKADRIKVVSDHDMTVDQLRKKLERLITTRIIYKGTGPLALFRFVIETEQLNPSPASLARDIANCIRQTGYKKIKFRIMGALLLATDEENRQVASGSGSNETNRNYRYYHASMNTILHKDQPLITLDVLKLGGSLESYLKKLLESFNYDYNLRHYAANTNSRTIYLGLLNLLIDVFPLK